MHRGYTKRWRRRWEKGYHKDVLLWMMMDYFIDFANWKDREMPFVWKGKLVQMVKIKRGECFFTFKSLSQFFSGSKNRVSRKSVRDRIKILEKIGFLEHKPAHKYQIIRVLNYDKYNPLENDTGHESTHKPATNPPQTRHQSATPNELKNDKNVKNNKYSVDFLKFHEAYPVKVEKKATFEKWKSLQKQKLLPSLDDLLSAIEKQKKWRENTNGEFRPKWKYPKTWLNQGCWEDEIPENKGEQKTKIIKAGDMSIYD